MRQGLFQLVTGIVVATSAGMLPHAHPGKGASAGTGPARAAVVAEATSPVSAGAAPAAARDARLVLVDSALSAFAPRVPRLSNPSALKMAFQAYYAFKAAHPERVQKPYLYFVDYGLDNRTPRGYVFDMASLRVVDGPFTVAHGRGSGRDGVPMHFSNASRSDASSLGLFVAVQEYGFTGHTHGRAYSSTGLRIDGVSGRFNDQAYARRVVVHGAPYVTPARAGLSEGCPAMEVARARRLIPMLANGGMVFLYSPNDPTWLRHDPWANAIPTAATQTTQIVS